MGRKSVAWTGQAKTDLRAIDQPTALRILHAVARYLTSGEGASPRSECWPDSNNFGRQPDLNR